MSLGLYIFDLDGTLVDTRADITTAVNETLAFYGLAPRSMEEVTGFVGDGVKKLVERCVEDHHIDFEEASERFNSFYWNHVVDKTSFYPGIPQTLEKLQGHHKAILTNKPYRFTKRIIDTLRLTDYFSLVVGGDSLESKKPSPAGIHYILDKLKAVPDRAVMIGDSKNDIIPAKRAGVKCVFVTYGFRSIEEIRSLEPDYIISRPTDLLDII
ncbi:MAG: HAD family hydrolase [Spirochaetota bacterium]